ncbi:MAG: GNAT family N-acetyltransferase [Acidobacteria bacterium]|nr:GNAT family N-acetyltransferase [Acidobacteriota bacterium]
MTIREATAEDTAALAVIQAAAPEASHWPPADYLAGICLLAEDEGSVQGFLAARLLAPPEYELLNLAVAPEYRRRGVAQALLTAALRRFPGTWYLEVRGSNEAASRLYRGIGFEEIHRRKDYYQHPVEEGVVFRREAC